MDTPISGMCTILYICIQFRNLNEITKIIKFIQMFIYSKYNNICNLLLKICNKTVVFFAQTEMHTTFYEASSTAFFYLATLS